MARKKPRFPYTPAQAALIKLPAKRKIFLEGPAGCGKTAAGAGRLSRMLGTRISPRSILVMVPQRTLAAPYTQVLRQPGLAHGALVDVVTMGGLARRMVDLFWPLVSESAGFGRPDSSPTFLTLETAQYYMARIVRPLLDQGYFESVTIERSRLYSQVLDNLNKAAVVGFPYTEIGARLEAAWVGESAHLRIYQEAQECANRFRAYCLANNLLDFSLQMEIFVRYLWPLPMVREYLLSRYRHLIVDNLEEDTPVAHDILQEWLPGCISALVIYDTQAGYRRFLGADPDTAYALKALCSEQISFEDSFVTSPELRSLESRLGESLKRPGVLFPGEDLPGENLRQTLQFKYHRYYPEMLDWVVERIAALVREENVQPGEIAILAPFLSDSLRFSVMNRLERMGIPARSHRPSRGLREEPATQCLLTLAMLAHPRWGLHPTSYDASTALMQSIQGLDPVRAWLLASIVFRQRDGQAVLSSFDAIHAEMQARITYTLGQRYQTLRDWIEAYKQDRPLELDHFLSRLFGEVLSQPGFGFHAAYDAGSVAANLIESAQKFRWVNADRPAPEGKPLAQEYVEMVQDGVIAAQYVRAWQEQSADAVLLAPAYTFLMSNRPVDFQFWLDLGSSGWWERLAQPLTHPYVLSRSWPPGTVWSEANEYEARQEALYRLAVGLIRRCRRRIYLGLSELGEQGYEQQGQLLRILQQVFRRLPLEKEAQDV